MNAHQGTRTLLFRFTSIIFVALLFYLTACGKPDASAADDSALTSSTKTKTKKTSSKKTSNKPVGDKVLSQESKAWLDAGNSGVLEALTNLVSGDGTSQTDINAAFDQLDTAYSVLPELLKNAGVLTQKDLAPILAALAKEANRLDGQTNRPILRGILKRLGLLLQELINLAIKSIHKHGHKDHKD